MAGSSERDGLRGHVRVGVDVVVGVDQTADVDQHRLVRRFARSLAYCHRLLTSSSDRRPAE